MSEIKLTETITLSNFGKPYIVAEVNSSHFGQIDLAKQMIDKIKNAGCDCVKFQSWTADTLYSQSYYQAQPIAKRLVSKFSLSEDQLLELCRYCQNNGIHFASTPYSNQEVDFLVKQCHVPFIKVASMEINNLTFLQHIASYDKPIILSTGMSSLDEIRQAVATIEACGNKKIVVLHCVSVYPAEASSIRLKNIEGLREEFPSYPIGYSDHTLGIELAGAAFAIGACMLEKHFTLDASKMGMDNSMATEPEEMTKLVRNCHLIHEAMGDKVRVLSAIELEQRKNMRRSIVAAHDLKSGSLLTTKDIAFKRPGTGIAPNNQACVIGKILLNDIVADTLINLSDLSDIDG